MPKHEYRDSVIIEDTRFIFRPNLSGNPDRDQTFHSNARRANFVITEDIADKLASQGYNVKKVEPKEGYEEDGIQYFVPAYINFDTVFSRPPLVYMVPANGGEKVALDKDTIEIIDQLADGQNIKKINVELNPWYNSSRDCWTFYIRTLYVWQAAEDDPFASAVMYENESEEDLPF